uniref:RIB43A-like with coiled-coils protein 1 n=1 Tax=Poecilia mexicana TaxID=48701 RepID=A0A3B3YFT9_9TELE
MYKVDLPVDDSKDKVVEARRSAERARKARFFNPRLRVMGVDLDALNQQVLENKHKRSLQRRQDEMLLLQDSNEKEKRKALQKDLNQFWDLQQQMKISHDVEVKGQYNLTIPESELGPSSMHIFEEMLLNNQLVNQDLMWAQQNAVEEERRKAALVSLWNDNQALAEVRALDRREQRRNEAADNLVEIWHTGTSDMLTETAEPAETYLGGGRPPHVLPDKWRGMSLAQLNNFHEQREQQRLEKKQHYLNKELYTDKPTRDYFAQFNTGCR